MLLSVYIRGDIFTFALAVINGSESEKIKEEAKKKAKQRINDKFQGKFTFVSAFV